MLAAVRRLWDRARRRTASRPVKSTLVLIVLIGLLGAMRAFAPIDWAMQVLAAQLNLRPYSGDITVVAFDEASARQRGRDTITRGDLARLLDAVAAQQPRQIVIDRLTFAKDAPNDPARLAEALRRLPEKPAMFAALRPRDARAAGSVISENGREPVPVLVAEGGEAEVAALTRPAHWVTWTTAMGAPHSLPVTQTIDGKVYPSLSQVLAGRNDPVSGRKVVDLSIDPRTVPTLSAAAVTGGTADRRLLTGRRILIASTADSFRDTLPTPHGRFTSRAYLIVAGASTIAGPDQVNLGWLPGFLIATAGALAWLVLRKPWGRIAAFAAFIGVLCETVLLERWMVFQQSSGGLVLILTVAIAHVVAGIRAAIALARNAAETKSWFLAQASHDLRQPIHAIGMLSARLAQTDLTPAQAELVGKIDSSVDGASRMFQSLLDIATIESGSLKPVYGPVWVDELFSDIEGQNAIAAERAGVELRFVPSDLILLTDRSLALTMLQNTVSNAIKYASGKKVLVGCRRRGNTAMLCVYDRGAGISREDLQQVTKAFFRASRGGAGADGAGLGLAIVHRLADLMNLRFDIASNPGRGTGATIAGFRLADRVQRSAEAAPVPANTASPLAGLRVLLVDDDTASLKAMEALLAQWGCAVVAQEQFAPGEGGSFDFDAVVSDYDFGQGKTLADHRAPVADLIARGASMVVMSGHHPNVVRQALGQEHLLVLAKPVRPAELRAVLLAAKVRQ